MARYYTESVRSYRETWEIDGTLSRMFDKSTGELMGRTSCLVIAFVKSQATHSTSKLILIRFPGVVDQINTVYTLGS